MNRRIRNGLIALTAGTAILGIVGCGKDEPIVNEEKTDAVNQYHLASKEFKDSIGQRFSANYTHDEKYTNDGKPKFEARFHLSEGELESLYKQEDFGMINDLRIMPYDPREKKEEKK
jgi:hypothetical protein